MTGCPVDRALDLLERGLEGAGVALEVHIDFEEGLENLLRGVPPSTDPLFHLVEGVLGGMQKGLIHGPVVIL